MILFSFLEKSILFKFLKDTMVVNVIYVYFSCIIYFCTLYSYFLLIWGWNVTWTCLVFFCGFIKLYYSCISFLYLHICGCVRWREGEQRKSKLFIQPKETKTRKKSLYMFLNFSCIIYCYRPTELLLKLMRLFSLLL